MPQTSGGTAAAKTGHTPTCSSVEDPPSATPPLLHGPERVSIYDLKHGFNSLGEEIFIQAEEDVTGRPKVWYTFDKKGIKVRSTRNTPGHHNHPPRANGISVAELF